MRCSFETIPADEDGTQRGLTEAMLCIQRKTHSDTGHAYCAVHPKAHGYIRAWFEVLADLPPALAQGLFALPASYDAVLRFSTTPGDVLHFCVSTPRGAALKVLGVPGPSLRGSEDETTQNYVLGNSPSFQIGTAKGFLRPLRPLAATTGRTEPVKKAISAVTRTAEAALEMVGGKSATLTTLAGQAKTHLLGDSSFSQAALLHGDYFSKVALSPVSFELVAVSQSPIDTSGHPDVIRNAVREHLRTCPAIGGCGSSGDGHRRDAGRGCVRDVARGREPL